MSPSEFQIFCQLLHDIHQKAFGEPFSAIDQTKSKALSWFIYQVTGDSVSYKTLHKYAQAITNNAPNLVNPSESTMGILVCYLECASVEHKCDVPRFAHWFRYRKSRLIAHLSRALPIVRMA